MILYRSMVNGDVSAGLALCRLAGWNQTAEDWELFLKLSPGGCCVAVGDEGEVLGTAATVRYEDRFCWIGMVLVDPAHQRRGIGSQLLREALHILRDEDTVKLDATPAGRLIYRQLNFIDEYTISRMEAKSFDAAAFHLPGAARLILAEDLPSIVKMDRDIFGAQRTTILRSVLNRAPQLAWICEDKGDVRAYCFGRSGNRFAHIGPIIARDEGSAKVVTSAALRNLAGSSVIIDAPRHSDTWIQWLSALGFSEQRTLYRMYRGTNSFPGIPEKQFAILGPEFG